MKPNYRYDHFTENISATHAYTDKAMNNEFHLHNSYEIYLFLKGNVNYFVEQSCYKLQKGNLLIFNSHEIHKAVNLTDTLYERITIHFKPQLVRKLCTEKTNLLSCFENREKGCKNIILLNKSDVNYLLTASTDLIETLKSNEFGSDLLPLSYLIQILVKINEIYSKNEQTNTSIVSPKIGPTLNYIEAHLTDDLSLDTISKDLNIDKYYLSHIFKQDTGSTLYQYILVKRIALAKQLLLDGLSVTEACHMAGFNDYSNFIRTFKKITGLSPRNFSKNG